MWRVNTAGGLTRERGMCESQKSQSLLSMPAGADMTLAIQELNGVGYNTSTILASIDFRRIYLLSMALQHVDQIHQCYKV